MLSKDNINLINIFNTQAFNMGRDEFTCCNCGKFTTIDDSVSTQGENLICNACAYKIARILNLNYGEVVCCIHNTERIEKYVPF